MAEEKEERSVEKYEASDEEKPIIDKWKKRFKRAKKFRDAYQAKWLRMYKLYRACLDRKDYPYYSKLMPPIAWKIVETLVSRLVAAKVVSRVIPREMADVDSPSVEEWNDLIKYDFDIIKLRNKRRQWTKSAVMYGNGIGMTTWRYEPPLEEGGVPEYDDPDLTILDLWDVLPAPETIELHEDCPWLIRRLTNKTIKQLEREEKAREGVKAKDEKGKESDGRIYKNLQCVEDKKVDDWKKERYEINTKKMAQIVGGEESGGEVEDEEVGEKGEEEKKVERWECWDFEEGKLIVIANKEIIIRDDDSPYQKINHGRIFINLPGIPLDWEFWAQSFLEPAESNIYEITDSRNQRLDTLALLSDPVTKIKKDSGITKSDIIFKPGAIWELRRTDDAVVEKLPDPSYMTVEEERALREEIESTLALSEYLQGIPQSKQEAQGKVAMLLGEANLRLSDLTNNSAEALTQMVNNFIQLNNEFISKDKSYRITGKDIDFKTFAMKDKEIKVDSIVEIEPVVPPDKETRINQILLLFEKLIDEDTPDANDPNQVNQWLRRKRTLQEMLLEEFGKEAYTDELLGEKKEVAKPAVAVAPKEPAVEQPPIPPTIEPMPSGEALPEAPQGIMGRIASKIPLLKRL